MLFSASEAFFYFFLIFLNFLTRAHRAEPSVVHLNFESRICYKNFSPIRATSEKLCPFYRRYVKICVGWVRNRIGDGIGWGFFSSGGGIVGVVGGLIAIKVDQMAVKNKMTVAMKRIKRGGGSVVAARVVMVRCSGNNHKLKSNTN